MTLDDFQNPYFQLPISFDPKKFFGSKKLVEFLLGLISDTPPHSAELLGLPGLGKSTLLRYLAHPEGALAAFKKALKGSFEEQPERLFPVLVEFRRLPPNLHPSVYLHRCFHKEYEVFLGRNSTKLPFLPKLPTNHETWQARDDSLNLLEDDITLLSDKGIRPVFLLDDFDIAFRSMELGETTRMRPWRQKVAFVLVLEQPLHLVNSKAAGSPFFQTIPLVRIDGLSREEAIRLLEEPTYAKNSGAGPVFPKEDTDFVLRFTAFHPYLLILAGQALWETRQMLNLLEDNQTPLNRNQQAVLQGRLRETLRGSFSLYWSRLESNEQKTLNTLILHGQDKLKEADYIILASLLGKGLIKYNKQEGIYEAFSPLFADFIREKEEWQETTITPELDLTSQEASLYDYLKTHRDRVCTFEELAREIWQINDDNEVRRRLQVTISRLRQKLQIYNGNDISSMRGQGYRLVELGSSRPKN